MDGLSSAASITAVVSLAFQLAHSAKQLCDFWTSIKDAPEDIRTIVADLELLTSVLAEMASEAQHTGPHTTLAAVLHSCTGKLKSLTALTNNLEPGFDSKSSRIRMWTAFKFILKGERLRRFQEVLESLKSTLVLAQQNRHSCLIRTQHEVQLEKLTTIAQSLSLRHAGAAVTTFSSKPADTRDHIAALRAEASRVDKTIEDPLLRLGFAVGSEKAMHQILNKIETTDPADEVCDSQLPSCPSDAFKLEEGTKFSGAKSRTKRTWTVRSSTNYFFGTIHTHSTTRQLQSQVLDDQEPDNEEHHYEHQSSFVIRPAAWLVNLGLNSGLHVGLFNSSVRGWKSSLKTFCAVPDNSLIFELSGDGNLSAVRGLFSRGLASVRDTNSVGETPLYVAAANHHPELCKFLIAAGADRSVRSERQRCCGKTFSPILSACYCHTTSLQLSTAIDTLRLFTDEMDFIETDGDGWMALFCVQDASNRWEPDPATFSAKTDLFVWMLRLFSPEIRTYFMEKCYAQILTTAFQPGKERVHRLLLELGPVGAIDVVDKEEGGYTTLQTTLAYAEVSSDLEMILAFDPDVHRLGFDDFYSPIDETPLSLALYSSHPFRRFTDALKKGHYDLDEFVVQELWEESPLMKEGWTRQTLLALFEIDFEPDVGYTSLQHCDECQNRFVYELPPLRVEIAWQQLLEHFKERHSPTAFETANSRGDPVDEVTENDTKDQTSMNPGQDADDVSNNSGIEGSGTDSSGDSSSGDSSSETDQVSWERRFWQHTVVCARCWHDFKRKTQSAVQKDFAGEDHYSEDSEDGFSPYLFNT